MRGSGKGQAGKAKAQGLSKGWPDLMLLNRAERTYRWIELKSGTGKLTVEQEAMQTDLADHMAVCRSLADVERALIGWQITPRCHTNLASR